MGGLYYNITFDVTNRIKLKENRNAFKFQHF